MNLPLVIGKTSLNEEFTADLAGLPHLFVSYTGNDQLQQVLDSVACWKGKAVQLAMAFAREVEMDLSMCRHYFNPHHPELCTVDSRIAFMNSLEEEIRMRTRMVKKEGFAGLDALPFMVVILDDVFDIILRSRKTGKTFLRLLYGGAEIKMHLVAASYSTYRNLLRQLLNQGNDRTLNVNPTAGDLSLSQGAEMVITSEDFVFFREKNSMEYSRFFPARYPG